MANKLQELRDKLLAKDKTSNFTSDNALYPFWNIPYSTDTVQNPALVRFLPDGDENNDFFWVETQKIKLTFSGIVGQAGSDKEVFVQVPCVEMWNETCPILTEIRPWFKDAAKEKTARSYWKKRSYIFQGFVRENPLEEQDAPENPIRRFSLQGQLFAKIKAGLMDVEMDDMPDDYTAGTDFKIVRTKKSTEIGTFANYDTSQYARKSTSLTGAEAEAIEKYGLKNLSDFMPKKPDADTLTAIEEMFWASVNGEEYDPERWGKFYRPAGIKGSTASTNNETTSKLTPQTSTLVEAPSETVATVTNEEEKPPFDVDEPTETTNEAPVATEEKRKHTDILADIKARAAAQKAS